MWLTWKVHQRSTLLFEAVHLKRAGFKDAVIDCSCDAPKNCLVKLAWARCRYACKPRVKT